MALCMVSLLPIWRTARDVRRRPHDHGGRAAGKGTTRRRNGNEKSLAKEAVGYKEVAGENGIGRWTRQWGWGEWEHGSLTLETVVARSKAAMVRTNCMIVCAGGKRRGSCLFTRVDVSLSCVGPLSQMAKMLACCLAARLRLASSLRAWARSRWKGPPGTILGHQPYELAAYIS